MSRLGLKRFKLSPRIGALAFGMLTLAVVDVPVAEPSTTYTVLYNLGSKSGDPTLPYLDVLAQARDGNLYTTSTTGGAHDQGTVFQLTPGGQVKVLHSFNVADGSSPQGGLTLGTDGSLYGTTVGGGAHGWGTIFKITTAGTFTLLHSLDGGHEGNGPIAPPIQGPDGNFFGTTSDGGAPVGTGTVYKLTPSGTFTILHRFGNTLQLSFPAALTLGADGNLYGTTIGALGSPCCGFGAVYRITPQGRLTVLHTFTGTDGQNPFGPLILASDGNFYGTTNRGGLNGFGTLYKMTPAGVLTDLVAFSETDTRGLFPRAGLVQATNGNFYGGAMFGPLHGGVLFQLTPAASFTHVHAFNGTDGANPFNTMIQHTNGSLYGVTYEGGTGAGLGGVAFRQNLGLGPFVTFLPQQSAAKVGTTIEAFGQGFTKATAVAIGGAAATSSPIRI